MLLVMIRVAHVVGQHREEKERGEEGKDEEHG
jgi:hypothetical protein